MSGECGNPRTFLMDPPIGVLETLSLMEKRVHPRIKETIRINNVYDSKVHSIIPTRDLRVSVDIRTVTCH
jgi:hypothetical protein